MATARKCDICGKLYEFRNNYDNYIEVGTLTINNNIDAREIYDLCRGCSKVIKETMLKLSMNKEVNEDGND